MPCPVTLVLLRANMGSGSSVRALLGPEALPHGCVALRATQSATSPARTQDDGAVAHCIEAEDTASGVPGRPQYGECCRAGH